MKRFILYSIMAGITFLFIFIFFLHSIEAKHYSAEASPYSAEASPYSAETTALQKKAIPILQHKDNRRQETKEAYIGLILIPSSYSSAYSHPVSEQTVSFKLDDFSISNHKTGIQYKVLSSLNSSLAISLYKRQEDSTTPGNLLLKFEAIYNTECVDIPEVSWNQTDELILGHGEGWMVKLFQKIEETNE